MLKKLLHLIGCILAVGCGGPFATARTCQTELGEFRIERPVNCEDVRSNVAFAQQLLSVVKISAPSSKFFVWSTPVIGADLTGETHLRGPFSWVDLGSAGDALAHEMLHLAEAWPNPDHQGWREKGWFLVDEQFTRDSIRLDHQ